MGEGGEYKRTLFDRHGPAALDYIRGWAYGAMVLGLVVAVFTLRVGFKWWTIPVGLAAGAATGSLGLFMAQSVGDTWKHLMIDGSSTPYIEQYSAQQALVMQGKIDEALASFESVIKERPESIEARIRAAELYSRDKGNFATPSAFRRSRRVRTCTSRIVWLISSPVR